MRSSMRVAAAGFLFQGAGEGSMRGCSEFDDADRPVGRRGGVTGDWRRQAGHIDVLKALLVMMRKTDRLGGGPEVD